MYLRDLAVKNFRNLQDFQMTLRPGFNLLVGRNNIGKSNLFQAIRHALGPLASSGDWLWLRPEDRFHDGAEFAEGPIEVHLTYAGLKNTDLVSFFEILDYNPKVPEDSVATIHFEAVWNEKRSRYSAKRWGGALDGDRPEVPQEILQNLSITFLPALRDAESALSPGRASRLAQMLEDMARRAPGERHEETVSKIFQEANMQLAKHPLVTTADERLRAATSGMAGTDFVAAGIRASEMEFSRILRTLRILVEGNPIPDLGSSGLGYNNLLFMATVLAHLQQGAPDETPLLLIEEPEAHLHPQLVRLLGQYLSGELDGSTPPQTLVATHSPALASQVKPSQVSVMFSRPDPAEVCCRTLHGLELSDEEERKLSRMLDITRAVLYFAKGLILVEGISEELLLPELARIEGIELAHEQVSVVPVCGVSFRTLAQMLGEKGLSIPAAIVTDADPKVKRGESWKEDLPEEDSDGIVPSERARNLSGEFKDHPTIQVFSSTVTLEYDLAEADEENSLFMAEVWKENYPSGETLKLEDVKSRATRAERALAVWRGICRASHGWSKAAFAHCLAEEIGQRNTSFAVPEYLREAIFWATQKLAKGPADES